MTTSDFIVVLGMLSFIGDSLIGLLLAVLDLYTSGSMIQEIANPLGHPTPTSSEPWVTPLPPSGR